ncbi:acetolactate synthase small subunit [Suicoccus acidiformans]|uniref:Acetolactate synthase small subunit n=1 Tax=Suicoccus acidiformans TaxID=2036206 RepID=A0A347WLV0_9LACT|nr:acetolactate synthase small subunit [Suicoccus acidiformans]AXY26057.1 acetolactate synthase small subunit [Suicoccus acidiformans]
MKRIITATVENSSGVLNRLTGLFARRTFNIESITVGTTPDETISKMTFVVQVESAEEAEQLIKQLNKQIDVIKVNDITDLPIVKRELALIKVKVSKSTRPEVQSIIEPFRTNILDVSKNSITIEVTGNTSKVDALIDLLTPYGIIEVSRTGITAFPRGTK